MNDKQKSLQLRQLGHSIRDIASVVNRSISTVQYWVSTVQLNSQQRNTVLKNSSIKKEPYYKQLQEKMFAQVKNLANRNNGKCLSAKYINAKSPLKFECANGHTWEAVWSNIKRGTWCPYCSHSNHINEEKCRHIFEKLTEQSFARNYTVLDNRQSLDGYNESLKLAFEFNGIQHYKYVWFFHRSKQGFEDQKCRDRTKMDLCRQLGIRLIVIPYSHTNQMAAFIKSELLNLEISITDLSNFSFIGLRKKNNKLLECKSFALAKNWKCLSEVFLTVESNMIWMCDLGHIWESCWSSIKNGSGCPKCHTKKLRKLFVKYNISNMRQVAQSHNGDCLSDEYINCKTHLRWQCSNKHVWYASPEKVIHGQWCRKCYIELRRSG